MAVICPTVTASTPHEYREQMERIAQFAKRVHIDLADGVFTQNKLIDLHHVWWPAGVTADIHLMYEAVRPFMPQLIALKPHMVIVQAESVGNYYDVAKPLNTAGIKVGVALLARTPVSKIKTALKDIKHVLLFSGNLGHFGGSANLDLLKKVEQIRKTNPDIEIGWDGGINTKNAAKIVRGGVDVLNVGGAIQRSPHPRKAYATLEEAVEE